jgi:hypothetical protein
MRATIIVAAVLAIAPALAAAQSVDASGRIDTSARGRDASGAINSRIDTRVSGALNRSKSDEPPLDVRRYVKTHQAAPGVAGSPGVGDTLNPNSPVRTVPGYPQWGYANSGNGNVIVHTDSGEVTDVVR